MFKLLSGVRTRRLVSIAAAVGTMGVLTVANTSPAAATSAPLKIVVAGDSYSAGNGAKSSGTGNYYGPSGCYRHRSNWAERYRNWLISTGMSVDPITNTACSGAETKNFAREQQTPSGSSTPVPLQVNAVTTVQPDVVLLTFGGNDAGFADIVQYCFVQDFVGRCRARVQTAQSLVTSHTLRDRLVNDVFAPMRSALAAKPAARIILVGYPPLIGTTYSWVLNDGSDSYDAGTNIRSLQKAANIEEQAAVDIVNATPGPQVTFVSATPSPDPRNLSFVGHEPDPRRGSSNANRWLNEALDSTDTNVWYHPNPTGHQAYANLLINTLGRLQTPPPAAPVLSVRGTTTSSISLSWSRTAGATGYRVYEGGTLLRSVGDPTSTVTITGLDNNTAHQYAVTAINPGGESARSNTVSTRTNLAPPSAPTLRTTATTASSISLAWTSAVGAVGYHVYEGSTLKITTSATTASIGSLASNSTHTYVVKAYNSAGESAASNPVSATTNFTYLYSVTNQTASADVGHARPGQRITITLTVKNTGTATWSNSGANPVNLATIRPQNHASPFQSPGWISSARPSALQQASVAPGGTGTFSFVVTAPAAAGTVTDYFTLVAENKSWFNDPGTSVRITTQPIVGIAGVPLGGAGYWTVANDGGVTTSAGAPFYGSMGGQRLNAPIVGMAATPTGGGYWLVGADGGVFAFGDAAFYGSMAGQPLNAPIVGMAATPSGRGYWLVGADGGVFAFGEAGFAGSMAGQPLNRPIVGIAAGPDSKGYRLVGADGGVFAYGDAGFYGSMGGQSLNAAITGIASTSDGAGYWLVGADGGIYAYGDAGFGGSLGGSGSTYPVVGISRTSAGYEIVDSTGTVTGYTATPPPPPPPPPAPTTLYPGSQLNPGDALTSPNGQYRLVMQGDGNLVEYDGSTPVWASNTFSAGSVLLDQSDGNFVIVAPGNVPVWATGTNQPGSVLIVQNDRNVVVYAPGNVPVWATNTGV